MNILRKREDSFHDLETVFYPVGWKDALEIIKAENQEKEVEYAGSGIAIDAAEENNLCLKAYHLLKKDFPALPSIKLQLHKAIPLGAGLGGGSADGAFTLKLLNDKFQLALSITQLLNYAAVLGSDAPFFIINKPCLATGRGEILQEIGVDLSIYNIVLINPGIHINTAMAFSQLRPAVPTKRIADIVQQPINSWKDELINDFEQPLFSNFPEIKNIKEELYRNGAVYAAMSGSGSTVFGIFDEGPDLHFNFPAGYSIKANC